MVWTRRSDGKLECHRASNYNKEADKKRRKKFAIICEYKDLNIWLNKKEETRKAKLEKQRTKYKQNPKKYIKIQQDWRKRNKEKYVERYMKYYNSHKEEMFLKSRIYYWNGLDLYEMHLLIEKTKNGVLNGKK